MTGLEHQPTAPNGVLSASRTIVVGDSEFLPERREDGVWYYGGTDIAVPGAVDRTLGEVVDARVVARRDGAPEAVLITRSEIQSIPGLDWVPALGKLLRQEPEEEYEVPWPVWQERSVAPIGVRAPERDSSGLRCLLATEERSLRFARWEADRVSGRRARTIAISSRLGETRKEIGDTIGLSTGRIQQIIEDLSPTILAEVDQLADEILAVVRYLGSRAVNSNEVARSIGCDEGLLPELVTMGLLAEDGPRVYVTEAGERAELHLRMAKRKSGQ
jgi:hypothetical protein